MSPVIREHKVKAEITAADFISDMATKIESPSGKIPAKKIWPLGHSFDKIPRFREWERPNRSLETNFDGLQPDRDAKPREFTATAAPLGIR